MLGVLQAGLLPAWFPSDVAFVLLLFVILAVLALNKGDWWFINVLAMDEPLIVALGATMAVSSEFLAAEVGGSEPLWMALGVGLALLGLYAVRSDRLDLDFIG